MSEKKEKSLVVSSSKGLAHQDATEHYLNQIASLPVLSKEEEKELALRWFYSKDRDAAQKLVVSNLRFVVKIAREYTKYGFKLSELIQEGNLGLMHAVDKYDPNKGYRLITYAVWWIRAYIQSSVLRSWSIVKTGTTRLNRKLFSSLQKTKRLLARYSPESPVSQDELAKAFDVDKDEFKQALQKINLRDISLDQPLYEDENSSFGEKLADESKGIEDRLIEADLSSKVSKSLDAIYETLKPRERYLLEHRLMSDSPQTLEEIGQEFGITRERVRQLEFNLKKKLQKSLGKDFKPQDID